MHVCTPIVHWHPEGMTDTACAQRSMRRCFLPPSFTLPSLHSHPGPGAKLHRQRRRRHRFGILRNGRRSTAVKRAVVSASDIASATLPMRRRRIVDDTGLPVTIWRPSRRGRMTIIPPVGRRPTSLLSKPKILIRSRAELELCSVVWCRRQ